MDASGSYLPDAPHCTSSGGPAFAQAAARMSMDMTAAEEQHHASWCPAGEGDMAADRARDEQSHPPPALPVSAITPALSFPMKAQLPMLPPLEQPHAWMPAAHYSSAGAYAGMLTGGGGQWSFRATSATVEGEGEGIQPASFLSAEEGARAHDAWAARMTERAARFQALGLHGTACALSTDADQRPSLGVSAWGPGQQRRGDADEGGQPMAVECTAAAGGGRASHAAGPVESAAANHRAQTAAAERGGKADCARYVGVYYRQSPINPFYAYIRLGSKQYHICGCATAEAAARAYDAIARMIPGRKLNFPTTSPVAALPSPGAIPSESELLAAIAAVRQPQQPRGEIQYVGVRLAQQDSANPFQAEIGVNGEKKLLGAYPSAEAAARAYDMVARTISGRTLNFPVATAGTPQPRVQAAACSHAAPSHPAQLIEQHVQPSAPRSVPPQPGGDDGSDGNGYSAAAEEPARSRRRARSDSPAVHHPAPQFAEACADPSLQLLVLLPASAVRNSETQAACIHEQVLCRARSTIANSALAARLQRERRPTCLT
jgi:hypothetical protein